MDTIEPSSDRPDIAGRRPSDASAVPPGIADSKPAAYDSEARAARDHENSIRLALRAGTLAIIAFQTGYTLLDRVEYPLTFASTAPLHIGSVCVGLIAFVLTLTPFAMTTWRALALTACAAVMAMTMAIAVIEGTSYVLTASCMMFFFAAGALIPWSPRWQAALEGCGALALLGYSMLAKNPHPSLPVAWAMLISAIVLSQLSSVHGARRRRKISEQVKALADNARQLSREIALRKEADADRERDLALLQASEEMLRNVFEASPDNIAVNSLTDGRFIAVNDDYQVAGYTRGDVMGSSVIALRMWKTKQLSRFVETVRRDGRVKNMEIWQRRSDGVIETNLISASLVTVCGETCVVSMTRDISEIKRGETRLRDSHMALRKVFDATLDIIVVTRLSDGKHIDFNRRFELMGYSQQDLEDIRSEKSRFWASEERHLEFRTRVIREGFVRNMEADFVLPGGKLMPALVSAVRVELMGEDCVVTMIRDLTAAREASRRLEDSLKALRDSEKTFRLVFDANLDSMSLTGEDGVYIDVNLEFRRATGFAREEAVGHHFTDLNMWVHPDEMIAFGDQLARTNEVRNLEVTIRRKDGSVHPELVSAVNLKLHGQLCCLVISREISDLKMTQRELVAAREAALAASRAKSEFLSSMSHEIRTPMNAILGMAELVMETDLCDEQRRYLRTLVSNGHVLLELINTILDLARVESGRLSLEAVEFDPTDICEKVVETLAIRAHEKGLELMVRLAPDVPEFVLGDPLRLRQILLNLVGNAIKFTEHGQVRLEVAPDAASATPYGLKFSVTDTGIGIAADKLDLLFNPFTQADSSTTRKYGGSGLGLAIVSRLVALMRGKAAVTSELGTGSTFSFTVQFGTPISKPAASRNRDGGIGEVRILLVDDNADSRSIVAELLAANGAKVMQAASGTAALAELARPESNIQTVVIDAAMPPPDGFDIAKHLAQHLMTGKHGPPGLVMMLGTNDLTGDAARLRALGRNDYVVKPVRRAELFAAVARSCGRGHIEPPGDPAAPPAIAPRPAPSPILDRPLRILLADDSRDNRILVRAYLKMTPHRLEEAEDGKQAVEKFVAGQFDLVLMDIQMPIFDGCEATISIRAWEKANHRRRTPIVALTASALEEAVNRTRAAGCDAHVTKPVKKSTLLNAIRDVVAGNQMDNDKPRLNDLKEDTCQTE